MIAKPSTLHPLSRLVAVDDLPQGGLAVAVETTEAERTALAAQDGLVALTALRGDYRVRREGRTGVVAEGTVSATLTQTCVVSLEPFESVLSEPVEVRFLEPAALQAWQRERAALPVEAAETSEEDEPDAIVGGRIDLGAITADYLSLGIDPYPRKPGADFEAAVPAAAEDEAVSPFASLKALRPDGAR